MKQQAISDEQIIAAILSNGTLRAASQAAGISERALYDRMNRSDFQVMYKTVRADLLRQAVRSFTDNLQAAVDTVMDIMADDETNPAVRLQAAQTIISNAEKFSKRLADDEDTAYLQAESNRFMPGL